MRRARGCPIPPAAPRMATLRSGTEEEKLRWRSDCFADEEERTTTDLNILEREARVYAREESGGEKEANLRRCSFLCLCGEAHTRG